jgi:repressor LexA
MPGRMAAGKPIEAVEDVDVIEVPPSMVGSGDHFVVDPKSRGIPFETLTSGII